MEEQHTLSAFDQSITKLEKLLLKMNKRLLKQQKALQQAYINSDKVLAQKIYESDHKINLLDFDVNRRALRTLLRHQPMAKDLRFVFSAPKIASNLERIGDGIKRIAEFIIQEPELINFGKSTIEVMLQMVLTMQSDAMKAWRDNDATKAIAIHKIDQKVDDLYKGLFRELLTWMMEDNKNISPCLSLLLAARYIERAGDHITNICEIIYFIETGVIFEQVEEKAQGRYSFDVLLEDNMDLSDIDSDHEDDEAEAD